MKKIIIPLLLLAILLAVYPFLMQTDEQAPLSGLPWQIEQMPDGSTRVFGIHLGVSRLSDAIAVLGPDMEVAVIAAPGETGSLEMYYAHYRVGLLSGKMVLQAAVDAQQIQQWRQRAVKAEAMASGQATRYNLAADDLKTALDKMITGITFVPGVNLDEDIILRRFGTPDEKIERQGVTHYRFANMGLDIALYDDAKDVLQYVAPDAFEALTGRQQ